MIVEVTTFRLADPSDEAAFLDADAAAQIELSADHHGLMRRTTGRSADGEWVVVTLWDSMTDAESSAARRDEPVMAAFWSLVEMVRVSRYEDLGG